MKLTVVLIFVMNQMTSTNKKQPFDIIRSYHIDVGTNPEQFTQKLNHLSSLLNQRRTTLVHKMQGYREELEKLEGMKLSMGQTQQCMKNHQEAIDMQQRQIKQEQKRPKKAEPMHTTNEISVFSSVLDDCSYGENMPFKLF
ncbi:hypothetical protein FGO68_gene5493 [Halteria grandinella]|uniref:Uncharacterized protein n=1 Tax=Halteria grandinella TaxID=5974 RepID=A0A8J8NB96_HALGN|nr:hypothetical protein FGO68_gene5493 [Halteria grandinella]